MASYLDDLIATRANIAKRLREMTEELAPDVSDQGRSVSWTGLFQAYTRQLKELDDEIRRAGPPYKVVSYGRAV